MSGIYILAARVCRTRYVSSGCVATVLWFLSMVFFYSSCRSPNPSMLSTRSQRKKNPFSAMPGMEVSYSSTNATFTNLRWSMAQRRLNYRFFYFSAAFLRLFVPTNNQCWIMMRPMCLSTALFNVSVDILIFIPAALPCMVHPLARW